MKQQVKKVSSYLQSDVDLQRCNPISLYSCFLSGFTSCITFSTCYIWCGFQTGNVAQLGLALARVFAPHPHRTFGFHQLDQAAFVSLFSFLFGTALGHFDGLFRGPTTRSWLMTTGITQILFTAAAAIAAHAAGGHISMQVFIVSCFGRRALMSSNRERPSWDSAPGFVALGLLSVTMGLQGIVGKRIGTPLNATIVLTTTLVELFGDPCLASPRRVPSRDIRFLGIMSSFLGAFVARAIVQTVLGPAGTIGILCGLRLLLTMWWVVLPVPREEPKDIERRGSEMSDTTVVGR